ncbi:MAG: hypothetical protein ACE361_02330 [Aureliella sp.]
MIHSARATNATPNESECNQIDPSKRSWLSIATRPRNCFTFALLVLLTWHVSWIVIDPHFPGLPKPVGDGPDYENIGFHLANSGEYRFDNSAPDWRQLYKDANRFGLPSISERSAAEDSSIVSDAYQAQLTAPRRNFLSTGRPPLLPMLIATTYQIVGRNAIGFGTLRLLLASSLAIAGALSTWLVVVILPHILGDQDAGLSQRTTERNTSRPAHNSALWSVLVAALVTIALNLANTTLRGYATDFLTEPLALLLLQLFVATLVTAWLARSVTARIRLEIIAGATLGLMILSRSIFVAWLPFLLALVFLTAPPSRHNAETGSIEDPRRRWQPKVWTCLLVFGTAILVCSPWWIRNCVVLDRIAPLGTQGAITLVGGYSDAALNANGEWQPGPEIRLRAELLDRHEFIALQDDTARESMVSKEANQRVRLWIREHWKDLPRLALVRATTHWNPYSGKSLVWKALIILGTIAIFLPSRAISRIDTKGDESRRQSFAWLLVGLPLISTLSTALLYAAGGRFLVPCYGVLFSLSGIGIGWLMYQSLQGIWSSASDENLQ